MKKCKYIGMRYDVFWEVIEARRYSYDNTSRHYRYMLTLRNSANGMAIEITDRQMDNIIKHGGGVSRIIYRRMKKKEKTYGKIHS